MTLKNNPKCQNVDIAHTQENVSTKITGGK